MKKKYGDRLLKYLQPVDYSSSIERELGSFDFSSGIGGRSREKKKLFLRTFTPEALLDVMKRVKLVSHLNGLGLDNLMVDIDVDDASIHYMKLYYREMEPDNLLLDLRLSESKFVPDTKYFDNGEYHAYDMVVIEWLSAQNPFNKFSGDRPQLPGQRRPGLGILNYCFEMMYHVAREVIKDGFLDIPDHVHGAIMYSKKFKFFDPAHEGVIRALMRDLKGHSLADISWGIMTQTIVEKYKNEPQPYDPSEQIFYVSDRMRDYFRSSRYRSIYNKYYRRKRFRFDYDLMVERRNAILASKNIVDL